HSWLGKLRDTTKRVPSGTKKIQSELSAVRRGIVLEPGAHKQQQGAAFAFTVSGYSGGAFVRATQCSPPDIIGSLHLPRRNTNTAPAINTRQVEGSGIEASPEMSVPIEPTSWPMPVAGSIR